MTKPTLRAAVGATATRLQNHYLEQAHTALGASARGSLADLRKYASIGLEHNPLALQDVLMLLQPELSDQELGKSDKPSQASTQRSTHSPCSGSTCKVHAHRRTSREIRSHSHVVSSTEKLSPTQ